MRRAITVHTRGHWPEEAAVDSVTGSAADVGLLVIAYTAPVLAGGFVMGAALDRFDQRRLLIQREADGFR